MRLPTVTVEQQIHEDGRQHSERLYAAFLAGERIEIPVTVETVYAVQAQESASYGRFWRARGFRIRTKRNGAQTVLWVWLEQIQNEKTTKSSLRALAMHDDSGTATAHGWK